VPSLATGLDDPKETWAALEKLARWAARFSPLVAPWKEAQPPHVLHGLHLDITGCAHLFGGEEKMCEALCEGFGKLGIDARLAFADTLGAAAAIACYGKEKSVIVPEGGHEAALRTLPALALRIAPQIATGLSRLGLKRIGDLARLPRASLTKRFGPMVLQRLEQALGRSPEPFSPLLPVTPWRASRVLAEPITLQDHILTLVGRLVEDVAPLLVHDGKGARALHLTLFRVDGETTEMALHMASATNDAAHIVKLFALKLDAAAEDQDSGFGFEAARLDVTVADDLAPRQGDMGADEIAAAAELDALIDRLSMRLGAENIRILQPHESHIPERAVRAAAVTAKDAETNRRRWASFPSAPRPLSLLREAEPAEVTALLPEGPPRRFRWRGVRYSITHAEGPERLRPEWWRGEAARERDYYIVEDEDGRRFWLYRDGLYDGAQAPPRWYVHGVFA
jgi:protein ImuB